MEQRARGVKGFRGSKDYFVLDFLASTTCVMGQGLRGSEGSEGVRVMLY